MKSTAEWTVTVRTEMYQLSLIQVTGGDVVIEGGRLLLLLSFLPARGVELRVPFIINTAGTAIMGSFAMIDASFATTALADCHTVSVRVAEDTALDRLELLYTVTSKCDGPMMSSRAASAQALPIGLIVGIVIVALVVVALVVALVVVARRRQRAAQLARASVDSGFNLDKRLSIAPFLSIK